MVARHGKRGWLIGCALLITCPMLAAQQAAGDPADAAEIRQQIQQTRAEIAEAARRMARLQRQLGAKGAVIEGLLRPPGDGEEGESSLEIYMTDSDELRMVGMPPRLGVLLGGPESDQGNEIIGLTPGGGAEAAGIEQGDLLVSVNDQPVAEGAPESIREALRQIEPGASVEVVVERNGERLSFDVETSSVLRDVRVMVERLAPRIEKHEREIVIMRPDQPRLHADGMPPAPPFPPQGPRFSGLGRNSDLISNHPGLQAYFGTGDGVVVLRIDPDNAFSLEDGDVVLSLDNEPVERPVEFGRAVLSREPGERVVLEVMRRGTLLQLEVTIPDRREPIAGLRHFEFRVAPTPPPPPKPPQAL